MGIAGIIGAGATVYVAHRVGKSLYKQTRKKKRRKTTSRRIRRR